FHDDKVYKSAASTYASALKDQSKRGFTLFAQTPFSDTDAMGTLSTTAHKYGLKVVGDLKKVPGLSICAMPEFQTRYAGLLGLKQAYGVTKVKFVPLAGISVYAAIDAGKCKVGDVFSTDPPLLGTKYTVLKDTKFIFGFQNVAPIVNKKVANALGPKFRSAVDAVSKLLTTPAMIAMNKAVAIDKKQPAAVAHAFLKANHLA